MTTFLRHSPVLREPDGTIIVDQFEGFDKTRLEEMPGTRIEQDQVRVLHRQHGKSQYLRAFQGHSGGAKLDAPLQNNINFLFGWTKFLYHTGSSCDLQV